MDLKELGQLLRIRREEMGVSISDISESTRISRSVLSVFELGDADEYPHPVYAKGFIRNYARALGIDPEECVQVLERELGLQGPVEERGGSGAADSREEQAQLLVKGGSPWPVLLGTTLLVGVLAALIWYFSFYSGKKMAEASHGEPVVEATAPAEPSPAPEVVVPQAVASKAADVQESGAALDAAANEETAGGEAAVKPLSVGASAASPAVPDAGVQSGPAEADVQGIHSLTIKAAGQDICWVGVWIPGQEEIAKDFTVAAGETVTYRFSGKRDIRFGRIETVRLMLDGSELKVEGTGVVNLSLP